MLSVLRRRRRSEKKALRLARLLSELDSGRARPAARRASRVSLARV
ncbi:MAG TPA: hypothetical protein VIU16_05540 [Gaiellaceae bacterium]